MNTIDHLSKFDGKSDEGFLVRYSLQSKAFRVYNLETKRVEENLHITFLEQDANDAAKALRKEFAQETKELLLQAGAAKASSTNIVNTISTPVSTASPYGGLSLTDPTNPKQDDSEIPTLEDIYQNP
ncbi:hypothetical protein Tco_0326503, partial [Tanacetum coccineum]